MNNRIWDLVFIEPSDGIEDITVLKKKEDRGFTVRPVTHDEMCDIEDSLLLHERFVNEALAAAGLINIYAPKNDECLALIRKSLAPFSVEVTSA